MCSKCNACVQAWNMPTHVMHSTYIHTYIHACKGCCNDAVNCVVSEVCCLIGIHCFKFDNSLWLKWTNEAEFLSFLLATSVCYSNLRGTCNDSCSSRLAPCWVMDAKLPSIQYICSLSLLTKLYFGRWLDSY